MMGFYYSKIHYYSIHASILITFSKSSFFTQHSSTQHLSTQKPSTQHLSTKYNIKLTTTDLIFSYGPDVVIKAALVLLGNHKELIQQCCTLESIVEFLKNTLPEMALIQMEKIVNQVNGEKRVTTGYGFWV